LRCQRLPKVHLWLESCLVSSYVELMSFLPIAIYSHWAPPGSSSSSSLALPEHSDLAGDISGLSMSRKPRYLATPYPCIGRADLIGAPPEVLPLVLISKSIGSWHSLYSTVAARRTASIARIVLQLLKPACLIVMSDVCVRRR
jgi:hypothetical protein